MMFYELNICVPQNWYAEASYPHVILFGDRVIVV